ncbi:recombinase RecT, partial [Nocardia niwae]
MTTTEIATTATGAELVTTRAATRSAIELSADQREWTPQQIAVLKQLGLDDVPAAQLDLFFHRCQLTKLDPFSKQIYLIGRNTKVGGYGNGPERWEVKYTIQTGIDGYRLNGRRAAKAAGESVKTEGPFWMAPDGGGWSDVWLGGKNNPPAAAKFVIIADGEPHVGIALYDEFVQTKSNGQPNSMWSKMPANQLAKCAEAQAWRKAYPEDFSGLVLEDAAQVIEPDGSPSPVQATSERVHRSAAAILAADIEDHDTTPQRFAHARQVTAEHSGKPFTVGGAVNAPIRTGDDAVADSAVAAAEGAPPTEPPMTKIQQRK